MITLGQAIKEARKEALLTQRQLAANILKEDGHPISVAYLNDIEHDRRNPSSDHMILQFAKALDLPSEYLYLLAKRIPSDVDKIYGKDAANRADYKQRAVAAYKAFFKALAIDKAA